MPELNNARISPARLALAVKKLRAEKEELDLIASDPVAIVGMGCRLPAGSTSPEAFWTALIEARDGIVEISEERWKDKAELQPEQRMGGYLERIDEFDAEYFGISPREAHQMDPQQRLLLEVTWEALWDAGIEPSSLAGTDTGVFGAIYNSDYTRLLLRDRSALNAHAGIGTAHSVATGRIAFLLDIKGPNVAVDSACSSSLVATHMAVQSLRARECGLAIVGASSLKILSDEVLVFSKWGMLARDGKCKTFDAAADGFSAGEGSGVIVLKRLADALQDGDRIRAVIRGTAVNHDGRTTVLTAPNGLSQQAVIRAALKNARLQPQEISYVETHGTGTALGDPIEVEALQAVYGGIEAGKDLLPCMLGAVKTNLGHLEAAAGIAGLIKLVLCLEHGAIPKNLHFQRLNPQILLEKSRLLVATESVPWQRGPQARVAAISSFGLGGTNAHLIVEEAPVLPISSLEKNGRVIPLQTRDWRKERFWLPENVHSKTSVAMAVSRDSYVHPLLGRPVSSGFVRGKLFESDLAVASTPYLAEHSLQGRGLVPFAAFLEIARAGAEESRTGGALVIQDFTLQEPLFLSSALCKLQVLVGDDLVEIASERGSAWIRHARAKVQSAEAVPEITDFSKLRARCQQAVEPAEMYRKLEATGLKHGPSFRIVEAAWRGSKESLALLRLPQTMHGEAARYGMHPVLLDGCLQTMMVAHQEQPSALFLPIALDEFCLTRRGQTEVWVHARITHFNADSITATITVTNALGERVASLSGFQAKRTTAATLERAAMVEAQSYELVWRAHPLAVESEASRRGDRWLLVESEAGSCAPIAAELSRQGGTCTIVGLARAPEALLEHGWTAILYDARSAANVVEGVPWQRPEKASIEFVFAFARSLSAEGGEAVPRLWVISSRGHGVFPGEDVSLVQAPLLGALRTLAAEHTATAPVLMDAEEGPAESATEMIAREIGANGPDPIVAFRGGVRYAARLVPYSSRPEVVQRLSIAKPGRLEDLKMESALRRAPEPHEIEIQVRVNGLNFRDVLNALGVFGISDPRFGAECAGIVVRVGSAVREFVPGQNVLAFAPYSFQSYVNVPKAFVARIPEGMTFAEAASSPVAFLTAHYGLHRLAGLSSGQRILIHASAGGLGLAAVQLAQAAGAEIFATAGSETKRDFLRGLGVEHVFDSRTLTFRSDVLKATSGAGVDIVLNSLSDDFIRAGLETVGRGGCFLEVGKRGIWTQEQVRNFREDIRYFAFDLGDLAIEHPESIDEMLHELMPRFATKKLRPLRTTMYSMGDAVHAFRTMAQAAHVGKIVLAHGRGAKRESLRDIVSGGSVLITGGLGALGGAVAEWLAELGARSLVLASRHAEATHPIVLNLQNKGVGVSIEHVDVASAEQMEALLSRMRSKRAPLTAIFHTAGVVQDAVLGKESWDSYVTATAAKVDGAWNLHRLTQSDPVKLMVFFSSAAAVLGSAGQGSYAAANAFLDALAHYRSSRGMDTLSVNWGAWASAGMAARLAPEHRARLERQGVSPLDASAALNALKSAIEAERTQVAIMDIEWGRFFSTRASKDTALFQELSRPEKDASSNSGGTIRVLDTILGAPAGDRRTLLSLHVKECARRVLSLGAESVIQEGVPLQEIGLDSLMALEMRNELAQSLDLTLSAGLLFNYPTVEELTQHLLSLLPTTIAASMPTSGSKVEMTSLHAMTDEEAELLLLEELDSSGTKTHA